MIPNDTPSISSASADSWQPAAAARITGSRKRLAILALLVVPIFLAPLLAGDAAAGLPEKIPVLGGSKAFIPAVTDQTMFFGSILVGIVAGLITGVIGAGGGYILTPALMSFGVRGIMAVGTDQFHLFAKAIMGTAIHRKMGNVNFGLAAWFVLGSLVGVTLGGNVNRSIFQFNPSLSDALISVVYVIVLGTLSVTVIAGAAAAKRAKACGGNAVSAFAARLQALPWKPRIRFDDRSISVYPVILSGLVVGFVAAIMGVGGGFLTFPIFVYGLGVSTFTTVGTDILQIIFTTSYSSIFQYAVYGYIFYTVAVGMLLGSLLGVQIGALVTKMVKGSRIRVFFALTVLAGFVNRLFALPRKLADLGYLSISRPVSMAIEQIGTAVFFLIIGVFSIWILAVFFKNLGAARTASGAAGILADRRKFGLGLAGLVLFAAVFCSISLPVFGGRSFVGVADDLFNQLAKNSTHYIPEAERNAAAFEGVSVDFGIQPREFAEKEKILSLAAANGLASSLAEDGRVRLKGNLAGLARAILSDSRLAFDNRKEELETHCGMKAADAIYSWWIICDGLSNRFVQDNRVREANYLKFISTRVLEPAYNFRGIQARDIRGSLLPVVLLLAGYVIYTLWYGFSLMLILEGLGISADKLRNKEEE